MDCTECGSPLTEDSAYCPACTRPVARPSGDGGGKEGGAIPWATIGGTFVLVLLVLAGLSLVLG